MFHRILAAAIVASVVACASAQTVTYQGRLDAGAQPADTPHDFIVTIYNSLAGGTAVAGPFQFDSVPVDEGLFTLNITPSPAAFPGAPRFVEIAVKDSANDGPFTTLTPRQPLAATPYALRSLTQAWNNPGATSAILGDASNGILAKAFINRDVPVTTAEWFGFTAPTGTNGFGGMYADVTNTSGRPFYGYSAAGGILAYHYFNPTTNGLIFNIGGVDRVTMSNQGITADDFRYRTVPSRSYAVSGNIFESGNSNPVQKGFGSGGAFVRVAATDALLAPVNLPDGAVVTAMTAYFVDNTSSDMSISLQYQQNASIFFSTVARVDTTGSSSSIRSGSDSSITQPVIDNGNRHYFLRVFMSPWPGDDSMKINSVRIDYTVNQPD